MNIADFQQLTREMQEQIERISEHKLWLAKNQKPDTTPTAKPQAQSKPEPNKLTGLSPEEFMKAYKADPDALQNQILKDYGVDPSKETPKYQTAPQQMAVINLPPKTNPNEILARLKNNESINDILTDLAGE